MSNMIWKKMAFFFHVTSNVAKNSVFFPRYTFSLWSTFIKFSLI